MHVGIKVVSLDDTLPYNVAMEPSAGASLSASIAFFAWPIVAIFFFTRRPFDHAIIWTVLGALLLLPAQVAIKFPMIPAIDKNSVASVSALFCCLLFARAQDVPRSKSRLVGALSIIYVFSPVMTSMLNNDDIVIGARILPGVGYYDGVSALLSQSISFAPYLIARRFLRKTAQQYGILQGLTIGGFIISFPMLFEMRMSPQLSSWIYGYFSSSFPAEMRNGGFRPVVFMTNGLMASFFLSTAFIAAVGLSRLKIRPVSRRPLGLAVYLGIVLVLCKSAGALIYGIVLGPLVRWTTPRRQIHVAVVLAGVALLYPVLRLTFLFPTEELVAVSSTFSEERAGSLKFRFDQEDALLSHASERLLFGWGRYGRNRVYWETGDEASVTDGLWIITLGQFGLVGFISQFGLFVLPVFYAFGAIRRLSDPSERLLLATLAIIVAITAVEQLPNSSISTWSWLLSGALLGRAEHVRKSADVHAATQMNRSSERPSKVTRREWDD